MGQEQKSSKREIKSATQRENKQFEPEVNDLFEKIKDLNKKLDGAKPPSKLQIKNNFEKYKKIYEIMDLSHDCGTGSRPMEVYKKAYSSCDDLTFPKWWFNLHNSCLKEWSIDKLDKLYLALKIEHLKIYLGWFKLRSYGDGEPREKKYYEDKINIDNYKEYEEIYNKYIKNYKNLAKIWANESKIYLDYLDYFENKDEIKKDIEKFDSLNLSAASDLSTSEVEYYATKFEKLAKQGKKLKLEEKRKSRKNEEDRGNYNNNNNYNSSSSNSYSSSSNNFDLKKNSVKLCQDCKNNCLYCKKVKKGADTFVGRSFGYHTKCKSNSCYICGKSSNVSERSNSYLCKSCFNSTKLDVAKCICCKGSFK